MSKVITSVFLTFILVTVASYTGAWKVSNEYSTCTMLDAFISVSIKYTNAKNQSTHKLYEFPNIRCYPVVEATGPCLTTYDGRTSIDLTRFKYEEYPNTNNISFAFRKITPNKYAIVEISVYILSDDPGQILHASLPPNLEMFPTPLHSTFTSDLERIQLSSNGSHSKFPAVQMEITMTKFKYRPFIEPSEAPPPPGPQSGISRAKVMSNAETWLHPPVPYSQSKYKDGYRTDCSGYVSMAWEEKKNFTTDTLLGITNAISKSDLKSGDILLKPKTKSRAGHVTIFKEWVDISKTKYWGYELVGGKINQAKFWQIPYPYWRNDPDYEPRRYMNIQPDLPPTPAAPSGCKVENKTDNQICLFLDATICFSINYTNRAGQFMHTKRGIRTTRDADSEGSCRTKFGDQTIKVSDSSFISLLFQRADTDYERVGEAPSGKYYIAEIYFYTRSEDMPYWDLQFEAKRLMLFPTPNGSSFSSQLEKVFIKDEILFGKPEVEVTFKDVKFQAFIGWGNSLLERNVVSPKQDVSVYETKDSLGVQNSSQKLCVKQFAIFVAFYLAVLNNKLFI